jgi:8-oxo-dGTP pyrophosphatase MutT (NUDIX family)
MTASLFVAQAAVVPMRGGRVCLVLSTSGKRWVIPKGRIERRQTAGETALQEAWEEAGLVGALHRNPIGSYRYEKCGKHFHVTVFFMKVTEVAERFPERDRRARRWVRTDRLLRYINDPALRELLRRVLAGGGQSSPSKSKLAFGPRRRALVRVSSAH